MESEGSLSHSQQPATCPYPEPVLSSPYPPPFPSHLLKIHLKPKDQSRPEANISVSQQSDFLTVKVFSTSLNHQAGGPPPVGRPRPLIQYMRSYAPYWRPFLHPQTGDAPCCGDRDPLILSWITHAHLLLHFYKFHPSWPTQKILL
jgi:hypothetical protein